MIPNHLTRVNVVRRAAVDFGTCSRCGSHQEVADQDGLLRPPREPGRDQSQPRRDAASKDRRRVPCPLDPSHSVYARSLEAHLRVCNAGRQEAALERAPYFRRNANAGPAQLVPAPPPPHPIAT